MHENTIPFQRINLLSFRKYSHYICSAPKSTIAVLHLSHLTEKQHSTPQLKLVGLTSTQSCYGHLPAKHQRAAEPAQFQLWATVFLFQSEDTNWTILFSSDPLVAGLEEGVANWRELQRLKEFKSKRQR